MSYDFNKVDKNSDSYKLGQKVLEAYAHDPYGLEYQECIDLGLDDQKAKVLMSVLGRGAGAFIDKDEFVILESNGFSTDFVGALAGSSGSNAACERAKWLADHVVTRWSRVDYDWISRSYMLDEFMKMGPNASSSIPQVLSELTYDQDLQGIAIYLIDQNYRRSAFVRLNFTGWSDAMKYALIDTLISRLGKDANPALANLHLAVQTMEDMGWNYCRIISFVDLFASKKPAYFDEDQKWLDVLERHYKTILDPNASNGAGSTQETSPLDVEEAHMMQDVLKPNNIDLLLRLASILKAANRYDEALEAGEKIDPSVL